MTHLLDPFRFVVIALSGWMNARQLLLIDYLREENRVLREQLGGKRLHFTDERRRRLAARPKAPDGSCLVELGTVVTPETLLAWHRRLIAQKYRGGRKRSPGRPRKAEEIAEILTRNGMDPAPEQERKTWKEFLEPYWELVVAADFFTIEAWTRRGLERFMVLFFIELSRGRWTSPALQRFRMGYG